MKRQTKVKALILAAGFGTRLRPLTDTIPKPLIPVDGAPIIFYTLALLKKHGIREVVVNLHHLGSQIRQTLGNGRKWGMKIKYSHEPHILGTGGGIKKAAHLMSDPFLVINGDIICDIDLKKLIVAHLKHKPLATLALRTSRDAKQYGLLDFKSAQLLSILGKPSKVKGAQQGHFMGIHVINKKVLARLKNKEFACIVQDAYIPALSEGKNLGAWPSKGYWSDCGTKKTLTRTNQLLRQKKVRLSYTRILRDFTRQI